ncbi:MAG: hypothetical protein BWY75_01689 [bacterium ADurb.Bin425]|jgi:hypothetical protein|nr:MAG: hypothetical protein BWY75_01689 [bacterium ADurb.Bin425]
MNYSNDFDDLGSTKPGANQPRIPEAVSYGSLLNVLKNRSDARQNDKDNQDCHHDSADQAYIMELAHDLRQGYLQDVMDVRMERLDQINGRGRSGKNVEMPLFNEVPSLKFFLK